MTMEITRKHPLYPHQSESDPYDENTRANSYCVSSTGSLQCADDHYSTIYEDSHIFSYAMDGDLYEPRYVKWLEKRLWEAENTETRQPEGGDI